MANVKVIFGSTTGATESAAAEIAAAFGVQAINIANATAADFQADLLILGSSTWGVGELQDSKPSKTERKACSLPPSSNCGLILSM